MKLTKNFSTIPTTLDTTDFHWREEKMHFPTHSFVFQLHLIFDSISLRLHDQWKHPSLDRVSLIFFSAGLLYTTLFYLITAPRWLTYGSLQNNYISTSFCNSAAVFLCRRVHINTTIEAQYLLSAYCSNGQCTSNLKK